ncbi:MAG: aminotransferase class V-fold PLP-dependent enzyme [Planctomycetota bacterium]
MDDLDERAASSPDTTDGRGLWIPGPVFVRPELRAVLARPAEGHRTPAIEATIAALDAPLARLFGARPESHAVGVHSATATALMELALRATGPRVLCLVNGSFSKRFADIAEALGRDVTVVRSALGTAPDLARARELLRDGDAPFDAVTVCTSETSTGAYASVAEIGAALADRRGALLLVDAVTLLGAAPIDASEHGLDFVLAGTQKALALPPGLGLYAASTSMLEAATRVRAGSWFLDLARIHAAHVARKPPMTPTVPLLRALEAQLGAIASGALEDELGGPDELRRAGPYARRFERHAEMARRTRARCAEVGVQPYGTAAGSPTVTCLDLGAAGLDAARVRGLCAERGLTVAKGYGELGSTCIRIGHMGDRSLAELDGLLDVLTSAICGTLRPPQ